MKPTNIVVQRLQPNQPLSSSNCSYCGSENLRSGAGLKPGQQSISCGDCGRFLRYTAIAKLQNFKRRKNLTDALELLEQTGIEGENALFILSQLDGGER